MSTNETARTLVDKFKMDTKDSDYTVIEGDDADQLIIDIDAALREAKAEGLEWAAKHWQDQQYEFMESCRDEAKRIREERK